MIAIGSGQFGQLHTTFSHTQNTCNLHAFEAEISFMPFSRLYTASRVAVILSGGCERFSSSPRPKRTFRPSWSRRGTRRSPVRPSVRPIRRYVHRLIGSCSRPLHVRSFVRACSFIKVRSFAHLPFIPYSSFGPASTRSWES